MHPEDAAARGLKDGDGVRVFNELGEVRCNLQVGSWIRTGTVLLPKGLWRKHTANGYTATALAPDTLSIDRLRIEDGRATLTDAVSGSRLVLDQMQFEGEVR